MMEIEQACERRWASTIAPIAESGLFSTLVVITLITPLNYLSSSFTGGFTLEAMESSSSSMDPLPVELAEMRKALESLLNIVIKIYISSWYTSISPRDRTFVHAVRNTALGLVDSIIHDLTASQQARDNTSSRMRELILETSPIILDRHIRAFKQAQEDCLIDLQLEALSRGSNQVMNEKIDSNKSTPHLSIHDLAQRYHSRAPHPGIMSSTSDPTQTQKFGLMNTHSAYTANAEELQRPVTPQGIDESLADALSSSITGLPGRTALRDPPVINRRSNERSNNDSALLYQASPEYLSALVDRILRIHLPPRDYASTTERAMITEIVANTILGNILRKCSEPWFLWRIGLSLMEVTEVDDVPGRQTMLESDNGSTKTSTKNDGSAAIKKPSLARESNVLGLSPFFVDILSRLPSIFANAGWRWLKTASECLQKRFFLDPATDNPTSLQRQPSCQTNNYILEPWLDVLMALTSAGCSYGKEELWSVTKMVYTLKSNTVDKIAEQVVYQALGVDTATKIVTKVTDILFPDGRPAVAIPDPSPEEADEMRRSLEHCIYAKIPPLVRFMILGVNEATQRQTITDALEVLSNASANTTVILALVESTIFALLPRMEGQKQDSRVDRSQ